MSGKAKLFIYIIALLLIVRIIYALPIITMASEIDTGEEAVQENTLTDENEVTIYQDPEPDDEPDTPAQETEDLDTVNTPDEDLAEDTETEEPTEEYINTEEETEEEEDTKPRRTRQ